MSCDSEVAEHLADFAVVVAEGQGRVRGDIPSAAGSPGAFEEEEADDGAGATSFSSSLSKTPYRALQP